MNTIPSFRTLIEKVTAESQIYQIKLPVAIDSLSPVLSKETLELHYNTLYKTYVKKALAGDGEFQTAGAKLHTLFFEQFQIPKSTNNPHGPILDLINDKFKNYTAFKDEFTKMAMDFHGSGWVYLSTAGTIKTIQNHKIVNDILILVDIWEHAYVDDYRADKNKYLKEIWKIINWNTVNIRIN